MTGPTLPGMSTPATYKDLCIDAPELDRSSRFWSAALDLRAEAVRDGIVKLVGPAFRKS